MKFRILTLLFSITLVAFPVQAQEVSDPFESVNRKVFWFNNQLDNYILEPVSKAYTWALPKPVRSSVRNFFSNLEYPIHLVSNLSQGKLDQVGNDTGRFLINSTFGILGLFDVAEKVGFEYHEEDFGTALGHWGLDGGPYLMLPLLGPSNVRDFTGTVVDYFLHPLNWAQLDSSLSDDVDYSLIGVSVIQVVDTRSSLQQAIEAAKEASVDYYSFVKNAHHQRRQGIIYDGFPPEEEWEDEDWEDDEWDKEQP